MAPCVVVERLEGNQQYSRAPVGEHAEVQAQDAECGCHEKQEVRQHPLIYTGAGPIHPVHGPLRLPATKAIAPKGFTFSPFWRAFVIYFGNVKNDSFYLFCNEFLDPCIISYGLRRESLLKGKPYQEGTW